MTGTELAWINAGSNVLGKALTPSPAGPSRADSTTGGMFEFAAPFVVTTGSGSAAFSPLPSSVASVLPLIVVAIGLLAAWKLTKKS